MTVPTPNTDQMRARFITACPTVKIGRYSDVQIWEINYRLDHRIAAASADSEDTSLAASVLAEFNTPMIKMELSRERFADWLAAKPMEENLGRGTDCLIRFCRDAYGPAISIRYSVDRYVADFGYHADFGTQFRQLPKWAEAFFENAAYEEQLFGDTWMSVQRALYIMRSLG